MMYYHMYKHICKFMYVNIWMLKFANYVINSDFSLKTHKYSLQINFFLFLGTQLAFLHHRDLLVNVSK